MFDVSGSLTIAVAAGVATASAAAVAALLPRLFPAPEREVDDSWRDPQPLVFRALGWLTRRLHGATAARVGSDRRARIGHRLDAAGLSYAVVPEEFVIVRWAGVVASCGGAAVLVAAYGMRYPALLAVIALLPVLAHVYPDLWLRDAARLRKRRIERDFPFFLDILVLTMKAGLAFPSAVAQATRQLPPGPFRHEMSRLIREVRTGHGRNDALARLAQRVRIPAVSNFVATVAQAEESGGALASSLAEQARQRRRERFQRAEKLANQAPVKMLFPLVAFLFPVTFIIIGFPMYEQMKGSGFFG